MRALFSSSRIHTATGALFALITISLFAIAMCRGLCRDEHQFVAAGALLATEGLLPYRDFPYFHAPNLVFVYAGLFRCSSYLFLTSRLFSALCSLALLLTIYLFSNKRLEQLSKRVRLAVSTAITVCAFANPLFRFTCWRAWNHPLPVLLTIFAFLSHLKYRTGRSATWLVASGLLIGLATGSRLTFAPTALPFLEPIFYAGMGPHHWRKVGQFSVGLGLGLVPMIVMFSLYPKQFVFGNLTYNGELYQERIQHKMLTSADLVDLLTKEPAQGILVTSHSALDLPLIDFAIAHAYRVLSLDLGATAFLPPPGGDTLEWPSAKMSASDPR